MTSFEPQQWTNSLMADEYVVGDNVATPAGKINLSNYYQWQIRYKEPSVPGNAVSFCFEDPAVHPNTPVFSVIINAADNMSLSGGSLLLSSAGVNWPTNQATIWVYCTLPDTSLIVWGSRRV